MSLFQNFFWFHTLFLLKFLWKEGNEWDLQNNVDIVFHSRVNSAKQEICKLVQKACV